MTAPELIEQSNASLRIWRQAPSLGGARTAAVGDFSCGQAVAGAKLLQLATRTLAREGFEAVIGPMDGDTWAYHRLVVGGDGSAPFFLEPSNPIHLPSAFEEAGFEVVARYVSSVAPASALQQEAQCAPNVTLRPLDLSSLERDLSRVHSLCLTAFKGNAFYRPISLERFLAAYAPLVGLLDPDLALLAEDEAGELLGFLFAYPNLSEGAAPSAAVIKTVASLRKGLGALLVRTVHERIHAKGYSRAIHALMHENNPSVRLSHRFGGKVFRRYALWGTRL